MLLKILLKHLRQKIFKGHRERFLSNIFFHIIVDYHKKKNIRILDFGSGFKPEIAFYLRKKLNNKKFNSQIHCYDFYTEEDLKKLNKHNSLRFFNLKNLNIKKKYDFILISDVLHHIGVKNEKKICSILKDLKKYSKNILIKDHFEYGIFSRILLVLMDFIGNYYNNVNTAFRYFRQKDFHSLLGRANLKIVKKFTNIRYYNKYFIFFNNPKLHFIYLLKEK